MRMYTALDTRSDALMVGSAMAVILRLAPAGKYQIFDRCLPRLAWPLLLYWGAITVFFWSYDAPSRNYYYFGSMLCGSIPGALALVMLIRSSGTICHRIFERPEAVFLGRIFYGILSLALSNPIFHAKLCPVGAPADRAALVDINRDAVLRLYRAAFHASAASLLAKVATGGPPAARRAIAPVRAINL